MLTQNMAREPAPEGIRVSAIAPGTSSTARTALIRRDPLRSAPFLSRIPMGPNDDLNELVDPVLFLASAMSSYVTDKTLVVDGSYLAISDNGVL